MSILSSARSGQYIIAEKYLTENYSDKRFCVYKLNTDDKGVPFVVFSTKDVPNRRIFKIDLEKIPCRVDFEHGSEVTLLNIRSKNAINKLPEDLSEINYTIQRSTFAPDQIDFVWKHAKYIQYSKIYLPGIEYRCSNICSIMSYYITNTNIDAEYMIKNMLDKNNEFFVEEYEPFKDNILSDYSSRLNYEWKYINKDETNCSIWERILILQTKRQDYNNMVNEHQFVL